MREREGEREKERARESAAGRSQARPLETQTPKLETRNPKTLRNAHRQDYPNPGPSTLNPHS